jgi:glycosyltransferase involved in cell wall biosynthesis
MLKNQSIICFAPSDWWGMNPSCTSHIVRRFAEHNKVLYINPFSSDLLGVKKGKRKGFGQRFIRKLKSMLKWLKQPEKNIYVFSPIFIPIQGKKVADAINNRILIWQIKLACRIAGIKNPMLWIENIRAADLIHSFEHNFKVYHISDLFTHCGYVGDKSRQQDREKAVSAAADLIICVSRELYDLKKETHPNVHYLPHGVDFELFQKASVRQDILERIRDISKPIAGYYGTLTGSNDIELWESCASEMTDVSFVLAGRVTGGDYSTLKALPNVHMLGQLPYAEIPSLCAGFDVCMLNWRVTDWIRSCNPLKMFEYMSSGKPIVSVEINEAKQYSDVISIAYSHAEFQDLLSWELENDTEQRKSKRIEIAEKNSWRQHFSRLSDFIENTKKNT